jgi:hypothetical protein
MKTGAPRVRLCACSHEQTRHALVDGRPIGPCLHGCGCDAYHSRRRGGTVTVLSPPAGPTTTPDGATAKALAAIARASAALDEAKAALLLRNTRDVGSYWRDQGKAQPKVEPPRPQREAAAPILRKPKGATPRGERRLLIAIAEHPDGVTRKQLTVLTGYKRSSRDTYLQRLRTQGLIAQGRYADAYIADGDRIRVTEKGIQELGNAYVPLPRGEALITHWRERLPAGERHILDALLTAWPRSVGRDELSFTTGYKRSSRDTYVQRLCSRELVCVEEDGTLALSSALAEDRVPPKSSAHNSV